MKKIIILFVSCLMALTIQAQRCVVLDFQIGTGVSEEDIEGISYEFRSKFNPQDYQILERAVINRAIKNFGYDKTDMTQQQILKVGRNLDATIVIVGTMNKFMDEYSVEIRAIDVSSGRTKATEGANFERTAYRTNMQKAANNLAKKLGSSKISEKTNSNVSPSSSSVSQNYVDLGLPSGTIWKTFDVEGYYTYRQAVNQFGDRLPTKEQWQELITECQWKYIDEERVYELTGNNGNTMKLTLYWVRERHGNRYPKATRYCTSSSYKKENNSTYKEWSIYLEIKPGNIEFWSRPIGSDWEYNVRLVHE